ncbi:unnamed protein product, partial [Vitis vinifera]
MSCFLLFKALVLITLGRNDFVNNYYLVPNSTRSRQFTLPNYVCYLISKCRKILMRLYKLGTRRVFVTGTRPMGCVPAKHAFGFTTSKIASCGQGPNNGLGLCTVLSNLCPN